MNRKSTDAEVVAWLRDCLDDNVQPTSVAAGGSERGHRWLTVAAASMILAGAAGVALVAGGSNEPAATPAAPVTHPDASPPTPDPSLAAPGIALTGGGTQTTASADMASRIGTILEGQAWDVTLREHASRRHDSSEIEWSYFADADRRLFFAVGPASLLSRYPDLIELLTPTPAGYEWPTDPASTTVAITASRHTILVRSELIDTSGIARPRTELLAIATAIDTELTTGPP